PADVHPGAHPAGPGPDDPPGADGLGHAGAGRPGAGDTAESLVGLITGLNYEPEAQATDFGTVACASGSYCFSFGSRADGCGASSRPSPRCRVNRGSAAASPVPFESSLTKPPSPAGRRRGADPP